MESKKIFSVIVCVLVLISAFGGSVQAATHTIYDNGTLSSTYTTYFKDILSGVSINDDYVAFRSGQYSYSLVVGDLEFNNGTFSSSSACKEYKFYTQSTNYNSNYKYNVSNLNNFSLDTNDDIIYSNLGDYPQLVERGAQFEIFNTILLSILMLSIVIYRIFYYR